MNYILLVEDDTALCNGLSLALQDEHTKTVSCHTLQQARELLEHQRFQLIILDVNLPDGSGLVLLRELRQTGQTGQTRQTGAAPVILLTANDLETDIVTGLELGAEDYITKPFSLAVLRARVNTQMRRTAATSPERFVLGNFVLDFETMEFLKKDKTIELSKTEQKLLRILLANRGITVSREVLVDRIWTDGAEYVDENALSVTISRLRNKLEDNPASPQYIRTVYGIGYTWTEQKHEQA